mgnify:CR=1
MSHEPTKYKRIHAFRENFLLYFRLISVFVQLRQEKVELEETLEKEQEYQVNKLMRKIEKLERDTVTKQATLEQVKIKNIVAKDLY